MDVEFFLMADKKFYEPIDLKPFSRADFLDFVTARIGEEWRIIRKGIWLNCLNRNNALPVQGWKIHISTVPKTAKKLFEIVAAYLIDQKVSFKFLADAATVRMTSSKHWARGGSGKFFTIYPANEEQFTRLLAELAPLTAEFAGPYILSDRRYGNSKVLYYRYGGIAPNGRLLSNGSQSMVLVAPDGREVEDERNPTFTPPDWVKDPIPAQAEQPESPTLNGRYAVEKALQFSNGGGVYVALDSVTGKRVALKEARAHVHSISDEVDAADALRHEFAILKHIEDCGIAPKPIELFQEWEHLFLAEDYLDGYLPLRKYSAQGGVFLDTRPTHEQIAHQLERDLTVVRRLAEIVDTLHERGIIWGDISHNNIMVDPTTLDVKIIDLESADFVDSDARHRLFTPGFADKKNLTAKAPTFKDDYFGVGSILLFLLTRVNGLIELKPEARKEMVDTVSRDFGLPPELGAAIDALLGDADARPKPMTVLKDLTDLNIGDLRIREDDYAAQLDRPELAELVADTVRFVKANADLHRKDRLFPADPQVFNTNPVNLAHGAAGVAYALKKIEGGIDPAIVDWILRSGLSPATLPPGLYHGSAGVAWSLLELDRPAEAQDILEKSAGHRLWQADADLYHGLAGWGLTNLKFWHATGERRWLDRAENAGKRLLETAAKRDGGLCWEGADGIVRYGLAHGSAGVALFLLHLDRALGGGKYLDAAKRALDHDLEKGTAIEHDGLSWRRDSETQSIISPYWKHGSAGIGIVTLRFLKVLKDPRYRTFVDKIAVDCDRKYTLFPGRNIGLTGLGEFMLDAYIETKERKFLNGACRVARGLKIFTIREREGVAFPGDGVARLSCDFASGSAGIALFLDRLLRPRPADFLLDEAL